MGQYVSSYREPAWDATALAEEPPARRAANGCGQSPTRQGAGLAGSRPRVRRHPPAPFPAIDLNGVKLHAVTESQVITHISGRTGRRPRRRGRDAEPRSPSPLLPRPELRRADRRGGSGRRRRDAAGLGQPPAGHAASRTRPGFEPDLDPCPPPPARADGRSSCWAAIPDTADGAARALQAEIPRLRQIAGTHFPPFGFQDNPKEMSTIIQKLSDAKPDIVFVASARPSRKS